ncbi:MAG: hypothetical protein KJO21_09185 [Verrucomicrobiae bacterium]|nr:hypothetical protein [Verrucomicrobiae bacterium]NNJ43651.1 hypothetical protein [Akkermansiaceae bacterium]
MTDTPNPQEMAESHLRSLLANNANDWENRKKLAQLLYNDGKTAEAADIIWDAPEIPSIDLELGFAIKILGKGTPHRAIRLINALQKHNKGKPVQNLGIANALMHYGMVMQAARFYGACMTEDDSLANSDLEHFLMWTDDKEKIWGDFNEEKPHLGELPWIKRDAHEAEQLKKAMAGHTTPIKIPNLEEVTAESVVHDMYLQSSRVNAEPTPPPAVTIPMDRVNPKDVLVDPLRGAGQQLTPQQATQAAPATGSSSGQPLPPTPQPAPITQPAAITQPAPIAQPTPVAPPTPVAFTPPAAPAHEPIPVPQPAPTQVMSVPPSPISTQDLHASPAPILRPTKTQIMRTDGKIAISKPTPKKSDS